MNSTEQYFNEDESDDFQHFIRQWRQGIKVEDSPFLLCAISQFVGEQHQLVAQGQSLPADGRQHAANQAAEKRMAA